MATSAETEIKKIGRIFTSNPRFARKGLKTFHSVAEVEAEFGINSDEANFANEYYTALADNDIKAQELGFESWGYYDSDTSEGWRRYDGKMTRDGISVTDEDGVSTTYESTNAALKALGAHTIISLTLSEDVVYISSSTKARTAQYEDLVNVLGADVLFETSNDDHLDGFYVQEGQVVMLDLNGHKYGGDLHCFVNKGLCYVRDSVGTGCLFTTNFDQVLWYKVEDESAVYDPDVYLVKTDETTGVRKIGWPHSSKWEVSEKTDEHTFYRETCECIRNEGVCFIEGGWIGTYKPTFDAVFNNTTWGNAIGNYGKGMLTITGGQFTTVTYGFSVGDMANQLGLEKSWMQSYDWKAEATASGILDRYTKKNWIPYTAVIDAYEESQIIVNGGTFYGLYNDTFEISGELTTEDKHGVLIINAGTFINGYPNWFYTPTSQFGGQSMVQASAPTNCTLPVYLDKDKDGWMPAVILGGTFIDNISAYNKSGGTGRIAAVGTPRFSALRFTGLVSVQGGTFNFDYSDEFDNLEVEYTVREQVDEIETTETPTEAVVRSIGKDKNFKPFFFLDVIDQKCAKEIADVIADTGNAYIFCDIAESDEDFETAQTNLCGYGGAVIMRKADAAFAELCKVTAPSPFIMEAGFADDENVFG